MQKEYKVRIDGIDIIGKSLYKFQVFENDIFNHEIKTQALGDHTKNTIVVFIQVKISRVNDPKDLLADLMVGVGFIVENYEEVIEKGEDNIHIIPPDLETLLKSISISTMRGIMFSEFRGTQLHRAILPIILMDSLKPIEGNLYESQPESDPNLDLVSK